MTTAAFSPAVSITVVVPVLNAICFLPRTIPSIFEAVRITNGIEIICVDSGSTDGSVEYLTTSAQRGVQLHRRKGGSIAASRNYGARLARGEFLSFLDADCLIGPDYFNNALTVLEATGAAATGCQVDIPKDARWIEATWHALHYVGREREVHYLNSGNFFIYRRTFESLGGFREDLPTGEDAEIGQRLVAAGYSIRAAPSVAAVHLGNPRSVREFYRRNVWHGLGMFGTVNHRRLDKPTAMMLLHLLATLIGLIVLVRARFSLPLRILIAVLSQLVVPEVTVAYRSLRVGRATYLAEGIALYWLYYWARLQAFAFLLAGQGDRYTK